FRHSEAIRSLSFSHDGKYCATGGEDGTVRIWEVQSGKEERRFYYKRLEIGGIVNAVVFAPDSNAVVGIAHPSGVYTWAWTKDPAPRVIAKGELTTFPVMAPSLIEHLGFTPSQSGL